MAESLGRATFDLELESRAFNAGMKATRQQVDKTTQSLGRMRDANGRFIDSSKKGAEGLEKFGKAGKGLSGIGGALGKIAAAFVTVAAASAAAVRAFKEIQAFEDAGQALKTLGVQSEILQHNLRTVTGELKANVSVVELSKAAYDVASAGFTAAADATDILSASAKGAIGGFSDINTVADATTSVLNAYGLAASNAESIVDGFITTQNDGKIVVSQYAAKIGTIAPIAAAAGVSIEELNAAISSATAAGVPVRQTFSGLRQAISSILKPTKEATDLADQLGIEFNAQSLRAKGLGLFLKEVAVATQGSASANAQLFGSVEALTAIQPLLNDGLVKYERFLRNQTVSAGTAARAAELTSATISSGIKAIGNALSNVVTSNNLSGLGNVLSGIAESINNISLTPAQREASVLQKVIQQTTADIKLAKEYNLDTTKAEEMLNRLQDKAVAVREAIGAEGEVKGLTAQIREVMRLNEAWEQTRGVKGKYNEELRDLLLKLQAVTGSAREYQEALGHGWVSTETARIQSFSKEIAVMGGEVKATKHELGKLTDQLAREKKVNLDTSDLEEEIKTLEKDLARQEFELELQIDSNAIDFAIKNLKSNLSRSKVSNIFGINKDAITQQELLLALKFEEKKDLDKVIKKHETIKQGIDEQGKAQNNIVKMTEKRVGQEKEIKGLKEQQLKAESSIVHALSSGEAARGQAAVGRSNVIMQLLKLEQAEQLKGAKSEAAQDRIKKKFGELILSQTIEQFNIKARGMAAEHGAQRLSLKLEQEKSNLILERERKAAKRAVESAEGALQGERTSPALEAAQNTLKLIKDQIDDTERLHSAQNSALALQQNAQKEELQNQKLINMVESKQFMNKAQQAVVTAEMNEMTKGVARNTDKMSVSSQLFSQQLNKATSSALSFPDQILTEVRTTIDNSPAFSTMNSQLSEVVNNTARIADKPTNIQVYVDSSTGQSTSSVVGTGGG